MIGLYLLTVIGIYALIWCWIVWWCKPRWAKWVLVLVAVAIPTWDIVPQHIAFRQACELEAGEFASSGPIKMPGFLYAFTAEEAARRFVEELGFKYIEVFAILPEGKTLIRVDQVSDGKVQIMPIDRPTSRFEYSEFRRQSGSNVRAYGLQIIDRDSGAVVASHTTVAKERTWVFRALFPSIWSGDGGACHGNEPRFPRLVPDFLSPVEIPTQRDTPQRPRSRLWGAWDGLRMRHMHKLVQTASRDRRQTRTGTKTCE